MPLKGAGTATLWGTPVDVPLGIPAGPLVNARYCTAAFDHGYDIAVYKTVRSHALESHPFPNVLSVDVDGDLTPERGARGVTATADFSSVTSITNSFGVPSQAPEVWVSDMATAVRAAGPGQLLIASFQGSNADVTGKEGQVAYVDDHAATAALVASTGAVVAELNLSCPNEGTGALLCFDTALVRTVVEQIRAAAPDLKLVLKLAYFRDDDALRRLIESTAHLVHGYAAINTIPALLLGSDGSQALPGRGREVGGVCGRSIAWAGRDMVGRLAAHRRELGADFTVVGVGGVASAADYLSMRHAGADVVMSGTGAMFHPGLAREIRAQLAS